MVYLFNKDKLVSYIVTVFTIVVLFLTASVLKTENESIQTSVNESKINTVQVEKNDDDNEKNEILNEIKN